MKKYYCIPVTDSNVYHNGQSLKDHLMIVDYSLYCRDVSFKEFFYGRIYSDIPTNQQLEEMYQDEKEYMKKAFQEQKLPESIIAVAEEDNIYEISTNEKLKNFTRLLDSMYGITAEEAKKYLEENPNYSEYVSLFFEIYFSKTGRIVEEQPEKKEEKNKIKRLLFGKNKNKNK